MFFEIPLWIYCKNVARMYNRFVPYETFISKKCIGIALLFIAKCITIVLNV